MKTMRQGQGRQSKERQSLVAKLQLQLAAINWREFGKMELRALFFDIIGSAIYAIGIYSFASKAAFAPGGITGISLILNYLFGLPIGTLSLLANIPIILLSLRFLGGGYLLRTLQTLVVNAIFLDVVAPLFPCYSGSPLLAALFAGALSGLGLAIIYNAGSCTGGTDLIIMSLRKFRPHLSIGQISLVIDGFIILIGGYIYGNIDAVLFGILYTILMTTVIDKFMYGAVSGKMSFIISPKSREISERISSDLGRGSTFLKGEGSYSGESRDILLCACSKRQLPEVRKIVRQVDDEALVIIMEYNEVRGEGFEPHDKQI